MDYSPKLAAALLLALASALIVTAQNGGDDYMLGAHNELRAAVGVGPVTWDPIVAAYAQSYANRRRADCQFSQETGPYGGNTFRAPGTQYNLEDAVIFWASEKQYYDHATNTCSAPPGESCQGYLQMVWRDTKTMGCGAVVCDGNTGVFVICNYSPPHMVGQIPY